MERKEIIHQKQRNKATTILACTEDYSRLTRLIGRLVMHQPYETVYLESLLPVSCKTATIRSWSKTHNYACKLPSTCCKNTCTTKYACKLPSTCYKNTCTTKQACYLYVYTFFLVTMLKYMHCSLLQVQCICFNKQASSILTEKPPTHILQLSFIGSKSNRQVQDMY